MSTLLLNTVDVEQGIPVDGQVDSADEIESFVNICVMIEGNSESEDDALEGLVMKDMLVQTRGPEDQHRSLFQMYPTRDSTFTRTIVVSVCSSWVAKTCLCSCSRFSFVTYH